LPDWSQRRIAREIGISQKWVQNVLACEELADDLVASVASAVVRAPREYRIPVAEAATIGSVTGDLRPSHKAPTQTIDERLALMYTSR
jgi:hypothetical protein